MLNVAEKPQKSTLLKQVGTDYILQSPEKRAAEWLDKQVASVKGHPVTMIADLTPALASALLNRNDGNRKISERIVEGYARDILNGAWQFNGEPIIISSNGMLNDGQHRARAVKDADRTIQALFVFGVERETRTTLDQGKARTVGDYLGMHGHIYSQQLAASSGHAWQHLHVGRLSTAGSEKPTKTELLAFVEANPTLANSVEFIQRKGADTAGGRTMLAFCHWTFTNKAGRQKADNFIIALIEGAGLSYGNPILYIRNRLINERGRLRPNDRAELIFRAWNAFRRGETAVVRSLPVLGGKLPEVE